MVKYGVKGATLQVNFSLKFLPGCRGKCEALNIKSCQPQQKHCWGKPRKNVFSYSYLSILFAVAKNAEIWGLRDKHLKIKPWPGYRNMEKFILEVHSSDFSKIVSCSAWPCCKVDSTNRGLHLKNTLCQSLSSFLLCWMVTCTLMPWLQNSFIFA